MQTYKLLRSRNDDPWSETVLPPTYSRRRRSSETGKIDVYEYDDIPAKMRIQATQILSSAIGPYYIGGYEYGNARLYNFIVGEMRRDIGTHALVTHARNPAAELYTWMETAASTDLWLDAAEYCLRGIDRMVRNNPESYRERNAEPDDAIAEFNARMFEAGLGYQFISGDIIRVDSMHLHKEVVLPALSILREARFASAEKEYRSAHEAFRSGDLEDCIVDCAKSFESVLKIIGTARRWPIQENDTASKLIQAAVTAGFIASYSSTSLNHLKGLLESSTPTIRNKEGGHGAGTAVRQVSTELAALQLHQTAAVILYLATRDAALRAAGQ